MYQRILVPVDGSDTSTRALQEAVRLSNAQTSLRLIYVIDDVYPLDAEGYAYIDVETLREAMRQTGERILKQAVKSVEHSAANVEIALLDANGHRIASVIDEDAKRWSAELIVLGTHGRSGIGRLLMGSVAEGVVRGTTIPVLLIHSQ